MPWAAWPSGWRWSPWPAWKLDFTDDPANPDPSEGTYGVTFIIFAFQGQLQGQVSYLPPATETTP